MSLLFNDLEYILNNIVDTFENMSEGDDEARFIQRYHIKLKGTLRETLLGIEGNGSIFACALMDCALMETRIHNLIESIKEIELRMNSK